MKEWTPASALRWLFDSERAGADRLIPRWIFLRALGLIYYSAFFSLVFQIRGLIGPHGILPANEYLQALFERFGHASYWYAPTLLWLSSGSHMLTRICWAGMIASLLLVLNFWPRGMLAICFVCFLSFVSAAQDFSAYQSDGMLLEAGFIAMFLSRRIRILCFLILTPWQIGIILSANYTFLNYLVLALGILLLDDRFVLRYLPSFWKKSYLATKEAKPLLTPKPGPPWRHQFAAQISALKLAVSAVMLSWIFYATLAELIWMVKPVPLPTTPVTALEPFRIANRYGLFARMTRGRYEIEFQGSDDGQTWLIYPFRFKPQDPAKAPGIYAPYQPRFDWNLWFASLSSWRQEPIIVRTEQSLLRGDTDVLLLFAGNPFPHGPPRQVRAVIWQYWFTTPTEKRAQGLWWRRQLLGAYAPTLEREPDGRIVVLEWPTAVEPKSSFRHLSYKRRTNLSITPEGIPDN